MTTATCQPHYAKMVRRIQIESSDIYSNKHQWYWAYAGKNHCIKKPKHFYYIRFEETKKTSNQWRTGTFTTTYLDPKNDTEFAFTFSPPRQDDWECGLLLLRSEPSTVIGCARDTLSANKHAAWQPMGALANLPQ